MKSSLMNFDEMGFMGGEAASRTNKPNSHLIFTVLYKDLGIFYFRYLFSYNFFFRFNI